jgi:hypothetical protein
MEKIKTRVLLCFVVGLYLYFLAAELTPFAMRLVR